jgi:hypothetical protein
LPTIHPANAVNSYYCPACKAMTLTIVRVDGSCATPNICIAKEGCKGVPVDCGWPDSIQTDAYRAQCTFEWILPAGQPGPALTLQKIAS